MRSKWKPINDWLGSFIGWNECLLSENEVKEEEKKEKIYLNKTNWFDGIQIVCVVHYALFVLSSTHFCLNIWILEMVFHFSHLSSW